MSQKYKRILLKISGEALAGNKKFGIDFDTLRSLTEVIKNCQKSGTQIAIVVGGGNFWRGRTSGNMNRVKADHMGMLATVINAIGLSDALEEQGVKSRVMTSIAVPQVGELYSPEKAIKHLEKGEVVIFGYGTGNAFFSTDTAASLRDAEIQSEIIFKATNVDGVYDSDPSKNPDAKKYSDITFKEVLAKNLNVMDSTAASMCRDNDISLLVFSMKDPNNISKAINGENLGTVVHP